MLEEPEAILTVRDRMLEAFRQMFDQVSDLVAPYQEGTLDWLRVWSPGRMITMQCDLCCMISPAMFERFVLGELQQQARYVDHALYHLDGPGAIKHLDAMLGIEELAGIQWVPGAGASTNPMDWLDLIRRIQAAGRRVELGCSPDRVRELLNAIDRRGVMLNIHCKDEATARELLADLDRIGC